MQSIGLIFVSNVRSEDVGIFNSLLNLSNAQMNMLSIQTPSEVDSTNIEIYSNGRDEEATGDFIGGSFLSVVNLDSDSAQSSEIMEIFHSLTEKDVNITELAPNNYMIIVKPGNGIDPTTKGKIVSLIKNTSTREDIVQVIDDAIIQVKVDTDVSVDVNGITPLSMKPIPKPEKSLEGPGLHGDLNINEIVEIVYKEVVNRLVSEATELNATVLEFGKNKDEVTSRLVEVITREVRENLKNSQNEPQAADLDTAPITITEHSEIRRPARNRAEDFKTPTPADVSLESVIEEISKGDTTEQTTIYNDSVITIKSLYEGGCESDEELFNLVLQNKDKLTQDELESACGFNMFKYYRDGINDPCSTRESMVRKIKAGL